MRSRTVAFVLAPLVAAVVAVTPGVPPGSGPTARASTTCDPIQTPPSFRGDVPTAEQVLGFPLGSQEVTAGESNAYVDAVDQASPRVVSGTLATSWQGRPLRFALVGKPGNVTPQGLAKIRQAAARLMDPGTPSAVAADLARKEPAIVWLMGNVHGGEESGTDSELRILFELADRDDCAAKRILDNALVGIIPTQNPDGREAETRENFYGFDMNRDWFARTQRETDGKLDLLRQNPGILHIDAHEMGGPDYFFPPNADPIYHEHTDFTVDLTDNLYGPAVAAELTRQGIPFFQNEVFDFFAPVFGDTVPSHVFGSVGMTFEKHSDDPISTRTHEHYTTQWVSLSTAAANKASILNRWHAEWVEAARQGVAGQLERNEVNDPGNVVTMPVPTDPVRHYFLRADDPNNAAAVQRLVRRLQLMDVEVHRLTAPLAVPDFKEYGRDPAPVILPAGTYWVPMAQRQKHWIQTLLNEDTYVPFPYFFDVSGWSNPLLLNIDGGRSGAELSPVATRVALLPEPAAPSLPAELPTVAVYQLSTTSRAAFQSTGWLRWLLEQRWHLPFRLVTSSDIAAGALAGVDVLLVPNGPASSAFSALGPSGRQAVVDWVNTGGRYVGWRQGGTVLAAMLGITTAQVTEPNSSVAGALLRVLVDEESPLAEGVGPSNFVFYDFDLVMTAPDPAHVPVRFPDASSEDFFISGFGEGHEELGGTAAVVDEPVGSGRVIVFSTDPNFRAWTEGA
ncbi:MAG: M14 family zinc carboxypeptidase, partial [Acidimicrobiales bacterium]